MTKFVHVIAGAAAALLFNGESGADHARTVMHDAQAHALPLRIKRADADAVIFDGESEGFQI